MGYFLLAGLLLASACATQSKTIKTESYETTQDHSRVADGAVVKRTETTETEQNSNRGTVDIVGKTLALPFRLVGGLIDLAL